MSVSATRNQFIAAMHENSDDIAAENTRSTSGLIKAAIQLQYVYM